MSIWILMLVFICYSFGGGLGKAARDEGVSGWWSFLIELPFVIGAYLIVGSQVELHT